MSAKTTISLSVILLSAGLAFAGLYEISFSSIDTVYLHGTGQLTFAQSGVAMVIEDPSEQQFVFEDVSFSLTTFLQNDFSDPVTGQAKAVFASGLLTIRDAPGQGQQTGDLLLQAQIGELFVEESTFLPVRVLTFAGDFVVNEWGLWWPEPTAGEVFALMWKLDGPIDDFDEDDLAGESSLDIMTVPEPASVILATAGAALLLIQGRKRFALKARPHLSIPRS